MKWITGPIKWKPHNKDLAPSKVKTLQHFIKYLMRYWNGAPSILSEYSAVVTWVLTSNMRGFQPPWPSCMALRISRSRSTRTLSPTLKAQRVKSSEAVSTFSPVTQPQTKCSEQLTLYVLNFSEGAKTYIYIPCHSSTLTWHRWLKSFPK